MTRLHRPLVALTVAMTLVAVVAAVGLMVDHRTVMASPIWLKPLKFGISLALLGGALAWMLTLTTRLRRVGWWAGTFVAAMSFGEMSLILLQVARGRASHFNHATAFDANVFSAMGMMVTVLWTATFVLGVVIALQRHLEPGLKWGLRLGMAVSLAGMALGFLMTVPTAAQQQALDAGQQVNMIGAHSVGVPDGGRGLPLTGWATTGGDLRIPHFVGLHALQVLPLLALALVALSRRSPRFADSRVRAQLVTIAAAGYAGLVGLLTWQALRGQPLIHPDGITLAAFAGLVGIVGLAAGLRLRTPVAVRSAEPVAVSR